MKLSVNSLHGSVSFPLRLNYCFLQLDSTEASASDSSLVSDSLENNPKMKEWEVQEEVAARQGITIRRRPPTGPALHYVGPFEFRLNNEGNTPRNILEEIIWHKDVEVSQVLMIATPLPLILVCLSASVCIGIL